MQEKEWSTENGTLLYEIENQEAVIVGWHGNGTEAAVPELLEGCPVRRVAKKAFLSKKKLRRVVLPASVWEVEDWAFAYCDNLREIVIPGLQVRFGKSVFLDCSSLEQIVPREGSGGLTDKTPVQDRARLLAAAVTKLDAYYLLDMENIGSREWLAKWDARMESVLSAPDEEGYSKQVLCGEEDYGSTDLGAFLNARRREKVRLALLRLLVSVGIEPHVRVRLQEYLLEHNKGCAGEETWEVIVTECGNKPEYYELFVDIGGMTEDNFDAILRDIGEEYPEMKAYFMRYKQKKIGCSDFFDGLSL